MSEARVVDFFIAGVQKGGTTALDALLRRHPGIRMASEKEAHFFSDDSQDWQHPDYADLHAFFAGGCEEVRGEATPIYSYWPGTMERIAAYNPCARIILCLRHPAFRAYSHWRMEFARKKDEWAFHDAISEAGRARVRSAPGGVHRVFSYVERGFYAGQIARIFSLFPRGQTFFVRTDELWRRPSEVLAQLHEFLGVPHRSLDAEPEYRVTRDTRYLGKISREDRAYLDALYRDDIVCAAQLTGLTLEDWLNPAYEEPMPDLD